MSATTSTARSWDLEPGGHMTRAERGERFKGNPQGGICPSAEHPHVFVYSDPAKGEAYGYGYDGWDGDVFLYTGEGQEGDQRMIAGNRAILEHREDGRAIRLFVADGIVPGSSTVDQLYLGEFEIDHDEPYVIEEAPDRNGELRNVFVFRLRPVGEAVVRESDQSGTGDAPPQHELSKVAAEAHNAPTYGAAATEATTATRRESDLVKRFENHLERQGHEVHRWAIRPHDAIRTLYTDTYDASEHRLYEAKGTSRRDAVRLAIGQLLDYRRYIDPKDPELAVLLPGRPADDLVDLLLDLRLTLVYETNTGSFEMLTP